MIRIRYILLMLFLTGIVPRLHGQYLNIVCTGDTGVVYRVQGNEGSTFNWEVEGGSITSNWGDSIAITWGYRPGEYEIRVQEFSKYGCPAIPVSARVLVSAPELDLGEDLEICQGDYLQISAEGDYYSYLWHNGVTNPSILSGEEGYKRVSVTDQYGCVTTDSLYLTVNPLPEVDLGSDTSLCGTEELLLYGGNDGVLFNWSTGETFRQITVYPGQQAVWVEVIDENNCVSFDTIMIEACSPNERFKDMPTGITPNGDGKNDVWRIKELEPFPQAVVEIFDRWGNLVYRSEPGYSEPWDGTSNDGRELPMDSYYFVIDLGPGEEPVMGNVTIIR